MCDELYLTVIVPKINPSHGGIKTVLYLYIGGYIYTVVKYFSRNK